MQQINSEVMEAPHFSFSMRCYTDASRKTLAWEREFRNTVMTVGKVFAAETVFRGVAYTADWYMGLISSISYSAIAAADTMASHAGWLEAGTADDPDYSSATRPAIAFNAAAPSGANAAITSPAVSYTFTSAGTVKGAFVVNDDTKDGVAGTLYSTGLFVEGDAAVGIGYILDVTPTLTVT